jgi:hypothetical protein
MCHRRKRESFIEHGEETDHSPGKSRESPRFSTDENADWVERAVAQTLRVSAPKRFKGNGRTTV